MLQWLLEQGWDWHGDFDEDISEAVARKGHLAVLRCLQHHGCAWDWRTCKAAATGGHLAVLQYAHQNGCEWSSETCEAAAEGATWQCCSMPVKTAVDGVQGSALQPVAMATSAF